MENKRLIWPDFLRIISTFCVVLIHATSAILKRCEVGSSLWMWSGFFNSMVRWAVPIFFMISGAFLLDPEKSFDVRKFFKKNVFRIVLCIVVWGLFYSVLDQYLFGTVSWKSIPIAIYGILTNHTGYHLWFLYTLLILYVSTPFLRIFTENASRKQLDCALLIWLLLVIVQPTANSFIEAVLHIENAFSFSPVVFADYGGYYLLGYRLKKYPPSEKYTPALLIAGILSFLIMPAGNMLFSVKQSCFYEGFSVPLGFFCFVFSVSLFSLSSRVNFSGKWISRIGKYAFGIYLVHPFFISLTFSILEINCNIAPAPLVPLLWTIVFFFESLAVSFLFSRISGLKHIV